MSWFRKNTFKRSEIIETDKSYHEIMSLLLKHSEERRTILPLDIKTPGIFRKVEGNTIYITSVSMNFWPEIELEINKYANPRLKVIYGMFWRTLIPYLILAVLFIASLFSLSTYTDLFITLTLASALFFIPLYENKLKRNFKEWLEFIL